MALRATKGDQDALSGRAFVGRPILAAAAFLGGQSRLKAGCGQNCPPYAAAGPAASTPHGVSSTERNGAF